MSDVKKILAEMEAYTQEQRKLTAPLIVGALAEARAKEQEARELCTIPKGKRSLCGAKTRAGGTCQARALLGSERCRLHGGRASTLAPVYRRHLREEAAYLRCLVYASKTLMKRA